MRKVVRAALVLMSAVVAAAVAIPAAYFVAVSVSPPVTSDGHRVMPLGQVAVAVFSGTLLAVLAAVLVARRGPR
jgi:hypothetical protein